MKLIHKGGFRERANRDRKYQQSENQKTTLEIKRAYQPRPTQNQADKAEHNTEAVQSDASVDMQNQQT